MNIGLIGSGGREHALCKKLYEVYWKNIILNEQYLSKRKQSQVLIFDDNKNHH